MSKGGRLMKKIIILVCCIIIYGVNAFEVSASDWPIYKGNIYFTGNNDEIIVKNNKVRWIYQAKNKVYNPIISDGKVYFVDIRRNVYCVDEESGRLLWQLNLTVVGSQFMARSRVRGTIKYPIIIGNRLFLTDNIAIYCINKNTGAVIWARTGMRNPKNPGNYRMAIVDGIYSNPVINGGRIFYGTRNLFMAREIRNGHLEWTNEKIKTYRGFPSFYDKYVFTQSMDYLKKKFSVYCLNARTGAQKWEQEFMRPHKIYPPVVYKQKVYMPVSKTIYCLSIKDGKVIWQKDYSDLITSNPSFTDREILFTVGNRKVVIINPETGIIKNKIETGERTAPHFVTIRDQIYIASTIRKKVKGKDRVYGKVQAIRFSNNKKLWEFTPPFPGAPRQPAAANGTLFFPAGRLIYALGPKGYRLSGGGGSSNYSSSKKESSLDKEKIEDLFKKKNSISYQDSKEYKQAKKKEPKLKMRKMKISIRDKDKNSLSGQVDVIKWRDGKAVYSQKLRITKQNQEITVPDDDGIEITINSRGYIPKKEIISRKDQNKVITLDKIRKGESFVVNNILFEFNEAYLLPQSKNFLKRLNGMMKRNPRVKIEVRGFTDTIGKRHYNVLLSRRRADAVVEYMVKNGISPERIRGKGFGPDRPIASNKTRAGRKKNRRVEFFIRDK